MLGKEIRQYQWKRSEEMSGELRQWSQEAD